MNRALFCTLLLLATPPVFAQERIPAEDTQKYARFVHRDPQLLAKTPLRVEADLARAVAMKGENHGGMIIPDTKLTAEALGQASKDPLAIGELWFYRLTLLREGRLVPASDLYLVSLTTDEGNTVTLPLCTLGARKKDNGDLEVLIYGKTKEPLLTLPAKKTDNSQELPIDLGAERQSDAGKVVLKLFGKYEVNFMVTELDAP